MIWDLELAMAERPRGTELIVAIKLNVDLEKAIGRDGMRRLWRRWQQQAGKILRGTSSCNNGHVARIRGRGQW